MYIINQKIKVNTGFECGLFSEIKTDKLFSLEQLKELNTLQDKIKQIINK